MAIQPIRRGAVGRSTYKASGDRPNGSQYRPTSPGSKRASQPIAAPAPTEGTDRFAIHAYGNTKITINGADFSVLTEHDPDYELPPFNPYLLAQKGVFVNAAAFDIVSPSWGRGSGFNLSTASSAIITDMYNSGVVAPGPVSLQQYNVLGIPLEIYNINITGPNVTVGVAALRNEVAEEDEPQLMSLTVDAPLGVSPRQRFYDQHPLMLSSDQYVTVNAPSLGSCVLTPKLARKSSWLSYLPAILRPPTSIRDSELSYHTMGIVIGFNGGTPKLIKHQFESYFQEQGNYVDMGDSWSHSLLELCRLINQAFHSEVQAFLQLETNVPSIEASQTQLVSGNNPSLFTIGGSAADLGSNSAVYPVIMGGNSQEQAIFSPMATFFNLNNPAYITIYPNHAMIKSDPSITMDLGVECTFNQNSPLVPFNVHATVVLADSRGNAENH